MKIGLIVTVLYIEIQLFYEIDFSNLTLKKIFFQQFPYFCHKFVLRSEKPIFLDFKRSPGSLVFFSSKQTPQGSNKTTFGCLSSKNLGGSDWSLPFFSKFFQKSKKFVMTRTKCRNFSFIIKKFITLGLWFYLFAMEYIMRIYPVLPQVSCYFHRKQ